MGHYWYNELISCFPVWGERYWPVCAFSQGREVIHEDLLRHFSLSKIHHGVRRPQHSPTLTKTEKNSHKAEIWKKNKRWSYEDSAFLDSSQERNDGWIQIGYLALIKSQDTPISHDLTLIWTSRKKKWMDLSWVWRQILLVSFWALLSFFVICLLAQLKANPPLVTSQTSGWCICCPKGQTYKCLSKDKQRFNIRMCSMYVHAAEMRGSRCTFTTLLLIIFHISAEARGGKAQTLPKWAVWWYKWNGSQSPCYILTGEQLEIPSPPKKNSSPYATIAVCLGNDYSGKSRSEQLSGNNSIFKIALVPVISNKPLWHATKRN